MAQAVGTLTFRRATFDLSRTIGMGVVNVTPDSFSDGGAYGDTAQAIAHGGALDPELLAVVAQHHAYVILGHLRASPAQMQEHARYTDVVREVKRELSERIDAALAAGVSGTRILVDPGLGFAKTGAHNLELIGRLGELRALGFPVVVGASRKSFLGALTGRTVDEREVATAAADTAAILCGASVVRVHDV